MFLLKFWTFQIHQLRYSFEVVSGENESLKRKNIALAERNKALNQAERQLSQVRR
jgi:hypothetical protein